MRNMRKLKPRDKCFTLQKNGFHLIKKRFNLLKRHFNNRRELIILERIEILYKILHKFIKFDKFEKEFSCARIKYIRNVTYFI